MYVLNLLMSLPQHLRSRRANTICNTRASARNRAAFLAHTVSFVFQYMIHQYLFVQSKLELAKRRTNMTYFYLT